MTMKSLADFVAVSPSLGWRVRVDRDLARRVFRCARAGGSRKIDIAAGPTLACFACCATVYIHHIHSAVPIMVLKQYLIPGGTTLADHSHKGGRQVLMQHRHNVAVSSCQCSLLQAAT